MLNRCIAFFLIAVAGLSSVRAQEALTDGLAPAPQPVSVDQPPPNSAWLDLRQNAPSNAKPQNAPAWVEAVGMIPARPNDPKSKTIFRIRVIPPTGDYHLLFFRLFFDDNATKHPELVAWDESGSQVLRSGELGSGVELPSSDSVIVPMMNVTAIDIEIPGDGKTVRGAYLDWMTSSEVVHPVNAEHRDVIPEPFSSVPTLHAPPEDFENFGTVTATLAADPLPVDGQIQQSAAFHFPIEAQP